MDFDSKWVAHSPSHVLILSFNSRGLPRALLNWLNFPSTRTTRRSTSPPLDGFHHKHSTVIYPCKISIPETRLHPAGEELGTIV